MLVSKSLIVSLSSGAEFSRQDTFLSDSDLESRPFAEFVDDLCSYDTLKNALDFLGATALLLVLSPLMLVIGLAIRLTSPGPAIYQQIRLTQGGKRFTMFKFRTMHLNAEAKTGAVWALKNDPRVTPIGRFLRATRLDELPQLINVLMGEMSLIGPRPERPEIAEELAKILPRFKRRLEVKAGISGLAQTANGYAASIASYRKKLALDVRYVQKRSLLLDIRIAFKTLLVILTGKGSC